MNLTRRTGLTLFDDHLTENDAGNPGPLFLVAEGWPRPGVALHAVITNA